jgi:hypothetical protein
MIPNIWSTLKLIKIECHVSADPMVQWLLLPIANPEVPGSNPE